MKSVPEIIGTVRKHLDAHWHLELAGTEGSHWPKRFPMQAPTSAVAATMTRDVRNWSFDWYRYGTDEPGIELIEASRRIGGLAEKLPTHLIVHDIDTAARIVGAPWPKQLRTARSRLELLRSEFPHTVSADALRQALPLTTVDFDLARVAARWFSDHDPGLWEQLTPRQVPIEGLHGKWLNHHLPLVRSLAGLESITLQQRPTRVYFTYLDPEYRRSGRRLHDSHTLTDHLDLPYRPSTVVIAENKDTAVLFPELPGGIAVEGNGNASVGLLPQLPWIADADHIIYWGDMDARGYEIVDGLRKFGLPVRTILMSRLDYETYERFGTNTEANGKPIKRRDRRDLRHLTDAEREVYDNLTDPGWDRHLRIEQERIPLELALTRVATAITI